MKYILGGLFFLWGWQLLLAAREVQRGTYQRKLNTEAPRSSHRATNALARWLAVSPQFRRMK